MYFTLVSTFKYIFIQAGCLECGVFTNVPQNKVFRCDSAKDHSKLCSKTTATRIDLSTSQNVYSGVQNYGPNHFKVATFKRTEDIPRRGGGVLWLMALVTADIL